MDASLVIITRNRKEELRRALRSASSQTMLAEVLVIDDGSTDSTSNMVRSEFPHVRLERSESCQGCISQRNRAAPLAQGEIIFSIDDDAEFSNPRVIEQTLQDFSDRRIGAVAIPYLEPRKDNRIRQSSPDASGAWVIDTFIGTAHAVRREVFLMLKGYREHLVHQGEERDFCLRMLAAGYVVRLGAADPIHHYESPRRSSERMDFYGRRNDVIYAWQNVPMPYLPLHLGGTILHGATYAVRSARHPIKMFAGMLDGLGQCIRGNVIRKPVHPGIYRLSRDLRKRGPLPLSSVINRLPSFTAK